MTGSAVIINSVKSPKDIHTNPVSKTIKIEVRKQMTMRLNYHVILPVYAHVRLLVVKRSTDGKNSIWNKFAVLIIFHCVLF